MIGIIAKNPREMYSATLYANRDDPQGTYFEFYYIGDSYPDDARQPIPNLIADGARETIATSWELDYTRSQFVEIGDTMYRINEVAINRNTGRQAAVRLAANPLVEYKLSLVKVANPKAVMRNG